MKTLIKAAALVLAPATALALAAPAYAQKSGIAVVNLERAVATSNAYKTAMTQMQTTYKPQIDAFNSRKTALEASVKQKQDALQTAARAAGGKSTPALQTQYEDLQKSSQDAQAELQRLGQPIGLAQAYIQEQIVTKLDDALKTAMSKAKVEIVLREESTASFLPANDLTDEVVTELNTTVPNVSITPPAGWQPGQQGQAPAAAATPPANPTQQPTSR
jgi:Skp family chaperone for outer membrane proteins